MAILRFTFYILPVVFFVGVKSGKLLTMDGDISRYSQDGQTSSVEDGVMKIVSLDYKRKGQCVRLVVIEVHELEVLRVKISCDIDLNGYNGKFQFGKALIFMQEKGNKNFKGLFNLENGNCLLRRYTVTGKPKKVTLAIDMPVTNNDCRDLAKGKNLLNRNIGNSPNVNGFGVGNIQLQGITGGTVSVTNRNDDYVEDSDEESEEDSDEDEEEDDDDEEDVDEDDDSDEDEDEDDDSEEDDDDFDIDEDYKTYGNPNKPKTATKPTKATKPKRSHKPKVTTIPSNVLTSPETHGESYSPTDEHKAINKQKVGVLNGNVDGYMKEGSPKAVNGRGFRFTVQKYVKTGEPECFKLVTVQMLKKLNIFDQVKISCEYEVPDKRRGFNLHIGSIIYEDPPFSVTYVIEDGVCVTRNYFRGKRADKILSTEKCDKLTKTSLKRRTSGVIPGTGPISPADLATMEKQIVAVMDGSLKGFRPKGSIETFSTRNYNVEIQNYVKGSQCVKLVSIKRNDLDQNLEQVKVSCRITGPTVTNDEDIEFSYGNVIYMPDRFSGVYITKDGACLQRSYTVMWNEVTKKDETMSLPDCYQLTRWRLQERSSAAKLNKQPPPKTVQAPGLMWVLSLNGVTRGYRGEGGGNVVMGGRNLKIETSNYYKNVEECIRLVKIYIKEKEVDRIKVSCGANVGLHMTDQEMWYGKGFLLKPEGGSSRKYKGLFNMRNGSCIKRMYTISNGNVFKSKGVSTRETDCKDLIERKSTSSISGVGNVYNYGDDDFSDWDGIFN